MMMARRGMENVGCRGALLVMLLLCSAAVKAVLASADASAMEAIRGYFAEGGDGAGVMYSRLSTLCDAFGSRQAGSAALEAAIDWQADRLREEGFEVTLQNATVSNWVRGRESATILHPLVGGHQTAISLIGLGFSGATGSDGVQVRHFISRHGAD